MKLSNRQKTALEKSIKKWELIVAGDGTDEGNDNCELCLLYIGNSCKNCPVYLKTKETLCHETPHQKWCNYCFEDGDRSPWFGYEVFDEKSKELAQAELDFLRGILAEAV